MKIIADNSIKNANKEYSNSLIDFSYELNNNKKLQNSIKIYKKNILKKFLSENNSKIVLRVLAKRNNNFAQEILLIGYEQIIQSLDKKTINILDKELSKVELIISNNNYLKNTLMDNYYKNKSKLIEKIFNNEEFLPLTIKIIKSVFDNSKITFFDIRKIISRNMHLNIVKVSVPYELTNNQEKKLEKFIEKKFSNVFSKKNELKNDNDLVDSTLKKNHNKNLPMSKKSGTLNKKIELDIIVDKNIKAGFIANSGDYVYNSAIML